MEGVYYYGEVLRDDAEKLLEYVGGKENIAAVTHCATRMRFVLNDQSKAKRESH